MTRPAATTIATTLLLCVALVLSGCGGKGGGLQVVEDFLIYTARSHPNPGTFHDVSVVLADAIRTDRSIRHALDEMAAADDPYGKAMSSAICTGLRHIADANASSDAPATTTAESWRTFLVNEITRVILRAAPIAAIKAEVNKLTNTASLATINPHLAYMYYQECKP